MGGTTWKPTVYGKLILATMDAFDLVDIQRLRHPRLKKYTYESKALKVRSRILLLLWEMLKMEMRTTTISLSKNKAKLTNTKESQIKARLEELDRLICNNFNSPDIDNVLKEYENLKMELQSIYDQKGKAAIFRSKCRWVENGERPAKYFFNLEKKNHNKKTIRELRIEDDSTTYNDEKILEAIERYYKTLYTCTTNTHEYDLNDFIEHLNIPKLTDEERDRIEGPITLQKCKLALHNS